MSIQGDQLINYRPSINWRMIKRNEEGLYRVREKSKLWNTVFCSILRVCVWGGEQLKVVIKINLHPCLYL